MTQHQIEFEKEPGNFAVGEVSAEAKDRYITYHPLAPVSEDRPSVDEQRKQCTARTGTCAVDWYGKRGGIVAIGCPHTDYIKVWPLPVEQPWYEDLPVRPGEAVF